MTIDEFDATKFTANMIATYHRDNEKYPIVACDFHERLVALDGVTLGSGEPNWVRCENITIVDA